MEIEQLHSKFEVLKNEYQICKRKLDSKCEALLILSKEMDQCRSERDQFKLMAEQLRERYQGLKRQLVGKDMRPSKHGNNWEYSSHQGQNLGKLLYDAREQTKSLEFEVEDLKQKLTDAQGDIKLLREQIARQRVGTTDEGINTRHFPAYEREDLVKQLESAKEQYLQLERDLQQVLDEKEEQVTERDVYKTKYERLNQELNYVLKGDEKRIVDIDALVMENKYLQDRLKQMEEEKSLAMATASKYKSILEKKKNKGGLKLGQNRNDSLVISQRQVQQLLEEKSCIAPSPQAIADLRGLASALLETVNDKNLALSHQRKTNKILGNRVAELEKKLKTLEVSGLWNVSTGNPGEKINAECQIIKAMIPQLSPSIELSEKTEDDLASEISVSAPPSSTELSPIHEASRESTSGRRLSMEDLDLLPTKEVSQKSIPSSEVSQDDSAPDTSHLNGENEKSNCSECEIFDKEEIDHFQEDTDTTEQLKQLMESVTAKVKARQTAGQVGDPVSICSKPEECESTECECTKPLLTESDKQQKKYESAIYNVEV